MACSSQSNDQSVHLMKKDNKTNILWGGQKKSKFLILLHIVETDTAENI